MKIDNSSKPGPKPLTGVANGANAGAAARAGKAAESAAPPAQAAAVALSPLAARLQEISAGLAASPPLDAQRIAEIKQAISDGRFAIDAGKIADGMIEGVRQLLLAQR